MARDVVYMDVMYIAHRFVIQTHEMAAKHFQRFLYDAKLSRCSFLSDVASKHKRKINRESHDAIRALLSGYV